MHSRHLQPKPVYHRRNRAVAPAKPCAHTLLSPFSPRTRSLFKPSSRFSLPHRGSTSPSSSTWILCLLAHLNRAMPGKTQLLKVQPKSREVLIQFNPNETCSSRQSGNPDLLDLMPGFLALSILDGGFILLPLRLPGTY